MIKDIQHGFLIWTSGYIEKMPFYLQKIMGFNMAFSTWLFDDKQIEDMILKLMRKHDKTQ